MFTLQPQHTSDTLLTADNDAGKLLIEGIRRSPVVPALYAQVAAHMVEADAALFGGKYRRAIIASFTRCGVLSVRSAATLVPDGELAPAPALAERNGNDRLARVPLVGTAYGLPSDLIVRVPSEMRRFDVAGGVPDTGEATPPAPDQAAGSFVEDLLRRGHIAAPEDGIGAAPIAPHGLTTHEIRPTEGGLELRRTKFDCGFGAN
jgi:hypothetical protein